MPVTQHASSSGGGGTNSFVPQNRMMAPNVRVCAAASLASSASSIGSPRRNIIESVDCGVRDSGTDSGDDDSIF